MRYRFIFLTIAYVFSFLSCRKAGGPCEEAIDINSSALSISFRDLSGDYLYREILPSYPLDSLRIFDAQGRQFRLLTSRKQIGNSNSAYFAVSVAGIYDERTDQNAFQSKLFKQYYVQYKAAETDSFTVCFKAGKTKCGSVFDSLNVFYRGQIIKSESNVISTLFDLVKP